MKKLLGPFALLLFLTSCNLSEEPNQDSKLTRYRIQEALLTDIQQHQIHTFRNLEEIIIERTETNGNYLSIDGMRIPVSLVNGDQVVLHPDITITYQLEDFQMSFHPDNSGGILSTNKIIIRIPVMANNVAGIVTLTGLSGYIRTNNEGKCLNF